jgi:hypothetical protein
LEMLSGPYEIRAPSSSMRLSVLFREESTMTPSNRPAALTLTVRPLVLYMF